MTYDQIIKRLYTVAGMHFDRAYEYYRNVFPTDKSDYKSFNGSKDRILGRLYWHWIKELVADNIVNDVQFLYEHTKYLPLPIEKRRELKAFLDNMLKDYMHELERQMPPFLVDAERAKQKARKRKEVAFDNSPEKDKKKKPKKKS